VSLIGSERYRLQILRPIADEVARLRGAFGWACHISVRGLGNRLQWQRSGVAELTLYLDHQIGVQGCDG